MVAFRSRKVTPLRSADRPISNFQFPMKKQLKQKGLSFLYFLAITSIQIGIEFTYRFRSYRLLFYSYMLEKDIETKPGVLYWSLFDN